MTSIHNRKGGRLSGGLGDVGGLQPGEEVGRLGGGAGGGEDGLLVGCTRPDAAVD